jgi:hypothetical protein
MEVGQLPIQIQNAASGAPQVPVQVPMAMPGQAAAPDAPDISSPAGDWKSQLMSAATSIGVQPGQPAKPTFSKLLTEGADAAAQADPQGTAQPGGWARALLAGAHKALAGAITPQAPGEPSRVGQIMQGLGNIGAVGEIPHGSGKLGGALVGIGRVLNAGNEQQNAQDQHRQMMAEANARLLHEQALVHQVNDQAILGSIDSGSKAVEKLKNAASPAPIIADGVTSDELNQLLQSKKIDATQETAFPTGRKVVGENPDGTPIYRTTYTALGVPKDVNLDPNVPADKEILDRLNKFGPPTQGVWGNGGVQHFTGAQFNLASQISSDNEAATRARNKTLEDAEIDDSRRKDALAVVRIGPEWNNALSNAGNDPLKALAAMQANPGMVQKFPNLYQTVRSAYGPASFDKLVEDRQKKLADQTDLITEITKDPTKIEGKTSSVIAASQAIINDPNASTDKKQAAQRVLKQAQDTRAMEVQLDGDKELKKSQIKNGAADRSNPSGLTGDAFIKTLPPGRAAALKAINDGSVAINSAALERSDKGQAYMDDIYAAYPDFQAYKGETWPKAYNEYNGSGATAKAKVNYNTALSHLQDLYQNSTAEGLYVVGSKPYEDRKAAYSIVVNEVGKAVKTGVITEGEGKELRDSLNGWLPSTAKERTAHVAGLLKNKIDEFQTAFQDSAPSAQIKVPRLISPQAQSAYDYITSGGKTATSVQTAGHKVGDVIVQNGRNFTVTQVDANGKVTGAK